MFSWICLSAAIALEVCGTTCMKLSEGFARLVPSVLVFVFYGLSFIGLTLALKRLEVSTAYAVWSGLGTALIALIGVYWFRESMTVLKFVSLCLIILGVVGVNLTGH
ncbi:MAG: multidrug efflux SMR transporter [Pirellulales bacterium]|nr:multidrug efflux SMR transporter [Pirellulales bacterium]